MREYCCSALPIKGPQTVLAEDAKDAARMFVECNTPVADLALEHGAVVVSVSGADLPRMIEFRVRGVAVAFYMPEELF